ncbi:MAG: ferredoxin--nitrite reductase [Leptolyngbyaceae cyanobacterium]
MGSEANTKVKLNKVEVAKAAKDGLAVRDELEHFAKIGWENVEKSDLELRLKWLGIFFRPVTPGQFMLRMRTPNGYLDSKRMRLLADIIQRYGDDGSGDITTRQNIQLRGVRLEDTPDIFRRLKDADMTTMQSGFDNVRNITGSPIAGIDPDEVVDTRELVQQLQDMLTDCGRGNEEFSNLPRKFNIALEGSRDNSIHAEINDIAFVPAERDGKIGFNVLVGGYLSAQRCAEAVSLDVWVPPNHQVLDVSRAILTVYTTNGLAAGLRTKRAKARLMWLVEKWGLERFRAAIEQAMGQTLAPASPVTLIDRDKQDHLGVHPQKQAGFAYVGLHVPAGRLSADTMFELARLADVYGNGEIRLTVEQNVILPFIPEERVPILLAEPLLQTLRIAPPPLSRSLVSCTGSKYCNFAQIETKGRGVAIAQQLDEQLHIPQRVRIHWTGCPNSCGQAQAGDIGLIGTKTRKDGETVEAVDIYMGGKVGKDAELGHLIRKSVPCDELPEVLTDLLVENFGATPTGAKVLVNA